MDYRCFTAAGFAAASLALGGAAAQEVSVALEYSGKIVGLKVVGASLGAQINEGTYAVKTTFRTEGVADVVQQATAEALASGRRSPAGALTPLNYNHTETTDDKRRAVSFERSADDVTVTATPPFYTAGDPAPTPAQRLEALDPLSAIAHMMASEQALACTQNTPVFDGKHRYDLRFSFAGAEQVRTAGYTGEARKCVIKYTPVAGFDPEDLENPEIYDTPIYVWFADLDGGMAVPVKLSARFNVVVPVDVSLEVSVVKIEATGS